MSSPDHKFFHAFNLTPQMGPLRFAKLRARFPTMRAAWEAGAEGLRAAGFDEKLTQRVMASLDAVDPDREWSKLEELGLGLVTIADKTYPRYLREVSSAPALLYLRGSLLPEERCLAIVGSRRISDYGRRATDQLARALSSGGFTLVSGLAYGTDTITHRACLESGGRTIAVLGSGLDEKSIYPTPNRQLAREIETQGCLISEYPPGTPPLKQHFPARNRIISGLSRGVLVVEASATSGSLITARFALEQNREVFAVPGSIFSGNSEGTNNLIKLGARPVTRIEDIFEEFGCVPESAKMSSAKAAPASPEEELVLRHLSAEDPLHIDLLARQAGMKTAALSSLLTLMEIKGLVRDAGGNNYIKK